MTHKRSIGLGGSTNLSVLAPIRTDMVVGFEPISYLERLRKVLDALHSARQNVRESELLPPVFPDPISRFGIIHYFRYALLPPDPGVQAQPADGTWRLSLNVTFDGGWEAYMRVIYRDLGALLDLLFCHSPGYPGSRTATFEEYCAWVRSNELESGIFYTDSAATLDDQHYLAEVEKAVREHSASDRDIARIALPAMAARDAAAMDKARSQPLQALVLPLRTLKGLYRLSTYFPGNGTGTDPEGDMGTLRRFARLVLKGPMALMKELDQQPATPELAARWAEAKQQLADELDWLQYNRAEGSATPARQLCDPRRLQAHMLGSGDAMTHGCVVLLRVHHAEAALAHIAHLAPECGLQRRQEVEHLIGFTHAGLQALGLAQEHLDALSPEFVDGMEARCALLGDVRGNHPDRWVRPLAHGQAGDQRVDLKTVHVFVLLRLADPHERGHDLHHKLQAAAANLDEPGTGLRVLAVQPTRGYRDSKNQATGHFGFADGLSQPQLRTHEPTPAAAHFSDLVRTGELLLGYDNDRGDAPNPRLGKLQMDGSFLVVRKLRQRVDHLDQALQKVGCAHGKEEVLAKMMGRRQDGTPLVPLSKDRTGPNDFDYKTQAASDACPFHSHVRRANPRDGRSYTPRILRRGMSYGPLSQTDRATERGVVFMAYCASIAEQFETLQRWISGGNNSGVGSAQADPFLRVPQAGESSTFRYLDAKGDVVRVQFDDKPLVQLEWGLYVFVPSRVTLGELAQLCQAPSVEPPAGRPGYSDPPDPDEARREQVRQVLDDPARAPAAWQRVRDAVPDDPLQDTPYGHLVGRYQQVLDVMKDDGSRYSVQGYGERMQKSIGPNLLGLDPGAARGAQLALNAAVAAIGEREAFDLALGVVTGVLGRFPNLPAVNEEDAVRRPIDLVNLSDLVMAALCRAWIGLPQDRREVADPVMVAGGRLEKNSGTPRCPGNFATASRYIFSPHPRAGVVEAGQKQGQAVGEAVHAWLKQGPPLGTLAQKIKDGLDAAGAGHTLADSLGGVLLGFPPTVQGNFIRTMETWIQDEDLWQHQRSLLDAAPGAGLSHAQASAALRGPLLATMRKRPVPEMLWRSPVCEGQVNLDPTHRVVLGITSALTDAAAPDELMFGRDRPDAGTPTVHGCPGQDMAIGVLLAMAAGLMKAGTLRPTGSPVLLILTPSSPPASPSPATAAASPPRRDATSSSCPGKR